jgi:hypothetical protein
MRHTSKITKVGLRGRVSFRVPLSRGRWGGVSTSSSGIGSSDLRMTSVAAESVSLVGIVLLRPIVLVMI